MTLEEAKERLKELVNYCDRSDCWDAFKTILNYIENESIPKEKVREKIYPTPENEVPIEVQTSEMYSKLQELLGGD